MTSEEAAILRALSGPANGAIPYADEDGPSGVAVDNALPRLGRSRIFAKEELMYATSRHPDQPQQNQFTISPNPGYSGPRASGIRNPTSTQSSLQERAENSQRRCRAAGSRRSASRDVDPLTDNPLRRYENALMRYRKPGQSGPGGLGGLRKDHHRGQPANPSGNGYSSSDSESNAISRCNKSKSTSSIDTQSVNNILDEYEDLDYGRSSDLSDSGSISVTNFEAVMDQRKRQRLQLQHQQQQVHQVHQIQQVHQVHQVERSNQTGSDDDVSREPDNQRSRNPEPVFKVNQQTQVRQRSRDRQTAASKVTSNSGGDDPARSKDPAVPAATGENRAAKPPVAAEVLLRKGEVQKRVDEWLNQTQTQGHFPAPSGKRDSGRVVALVRSSSSAEPKNGAARRCRNDSRSRSTDENSGGDRLNGTASYDDINERQQEKEAARSERTRLERTRNVGAAATRGTYRDYLAVRSRSRLGADYGLGCQAAGRLGDTGIVSRIPQRGQIGGSSASRRRETLEDTVEPGCTVAGLVVTPSRQERNPSRATRTAETRTGMTKPDLRSVGATSTATPSTPSTPVFANGRAASFKRARSSDRQTGIGSGRVASVAAKEDQSGSSGNSRIRCGLQKQQQQQLASKGLLAAAEQPQEQRTTATSPNKVGESRRSLAAGRESRSADVPIQPAGLMMPEVSRQRRATTNDREQDSRQGNQETNHTRSIGTNASPEAIETGTEVKPSQEDLEVALVPDAPGDSAEQVLGSPSARPKPPRSRLVREGSNGAPRRPPAPPRRDHSRRDKPETTSQPADQTADQQSCSSFRPANKRVYSGLRQLNEKNSFTGPVVPVGTTTEPSTPARSHYAAPRQVERIYERTIEPEVIHADDLESILKPVPLASAYGEAEATRSPEGPPTVSTGLDGEEAEGLSGRDRILIEDTRRTDSPRSPRYPDVGLDQCLRVQRRHPSSRVPNREVPVEKRDLPTKCWERDGRETNQEPVKTFGTFGSRCRGSSNEGTDKLNKGNELDIDEAVVVDADEPTYHEPDLVTTTSKPKVTLADSYEARSTLRLDRNLTEVVSRDLEDQKATKVAIPDGVQSEDVRAANSKPEGLAMTPEGSLGSTAGKFPEVEDNKSRAVVSEVLVKNLRFQQDVPRQEAPPRPLGPAPTCPKPFNFNSVLSDDYERIQAGDCPAKTGDEHEIYVTKEEMERQRMMDLLRRGDYEAVKLELERSYTLSTPGGGSPVCCPPCSPPPAPAAYISSVRASSRRLATGNGLGGPTSPDRDPLGKLLRYLKTFYRELGTRDPRHLPPWASPLPLGTLCPAHFQPHLQLVHKSEQEHRLENIKIDQIFAPVRLTDGTVSEAPRRVAVEGGPGSGRTTLCLRLLHHWATQGEGPALAFMVPLRELRGSPLLTYLARELFPRTSALGDAVAQVWRTLHLMEDRVLFVLDGYDECLGGRASLGDAADLLEGRLFPDARILVTCAPSNSSTLAPLVQRRIHLAGLEWSHVERLCVAYFIHNDLAERACEFLEALNVQPTPVKQLVQHPLGWVMLCALYQDSGSLPTEPSALVQAALKCIVRRSLDRPVPHDEDIPGHCRKRLEDFGKLSLAALREGRCCYTEAELRARGGGIEVTRLGFLSRGLTFGQRRKADLYTPIHMAIAEFLAAYYLTSVAQYANILRRELEGLPSGIIGHLAGLLGPRTHLILNQLCPLEVPPRTVFSLLKAAGPSDGNISAVCRLVGAGPGFGPAPNDRPPAPLVQTSPLELEGWTRILESSACTLEALEVVFQVERGSDPRYLDEFFEALAGNESVKLVRITSLLGQEFPADEAQRLAGHLKCVLGKKRLNDFEVVITCLEESAHDRLECVVNALCRGLGHASNNLARLVLDMNLSGEQVSRVCEALRNCVQVQALHLPHLSCGCEGLASVAELLKERPLLALNLAGSWGAKNEDPSSSGISMGSGSGSGSSGCASSTLGTLPLNRCYSSLPRGALAAYGSMTRPATLPRLPLGLGLGPNPGSGNGPLPSGDRDRDSNSSSKRNSDSVLCHRLPLMHPLPTCEVASHQGTGFHEIFNAIREPNCKLRSLNVSKCLQGGLDAGCLGETIRRARYLDALRASGASRPADVMPLVLALTEAPCLQLLDLASPRLALDDHPSRLLCHALARNGTLRLLSLEGWTFRIEESDSLAVFSELLMCTSVRELSLCNARLHLAVHEGPLSRLGRRDDAGAELLRAAPPPACPTIVFLRLAGFQVTVNDRPALRGPLLLPFLAGFTALSELDLSLDKSEIGGSSSSLLFIDDKILQHFFGCLAANFRNLQSLRINFWRVTLEDSERTMRQIAKNLKLCNLSFLKASGLIVTDSAKKVQMEHVFLQTVLSSLQNLTWLCLDGVKLTDAQASSVGKCIRDRYPGANLEISAKDIHVKSVKSLVAAVEDGGRAEIVYTGGSSSCRLKITKIQKNGKGKKK